MFILGCHFEHQASEVTEFVFAQSALPPPDRELPDAFRGIPPDDAETSGVAEQGPQGTNRSTGDAGGPGRPAPASFHPSAKAPPSARLAPTPLRERALLCTRRAPGGNHPSFTFSGENKVQLTGRAHCTVRWHFRLRRWQGAQVEAVYCRGLDADKQRQAAFGWIVVSEPVSCD